MHANPHDVAVQNEGRHATESERPWSSEACYAPHRFTTARDEKPLHKQGKQHTQPRP